MAGRFDHPHNKFARRYKKTSRGSATQIKPTYIRDHATPIECLPLPRGDSSEIAAGVSGAWCECPPLIFPRGLPSPRSYGLTHYREGYLASNCVHKAVNIYSAPLYKCRVAATASRLTSRILPHVSLGASKLLKPASTTPRSYGRRHRSWHFEPQAQVNC